MKTQVEGTPTIPRILFYRKPKEEEKREAARWTNIKTIPRDLENLALIMLVTGYVEGLKVKEGREPVVANNVDIPNDRDTWEVNLIL